MSEKGYLASVITPFHNTDLGYFEKALDSVVNQTAGIENVEWVITVHNSEDSYLQGVREMTKDYESICVYELHNDVRSASSPRNYALDRAHGKYVFFLDSDDRLTPECIRDVTDKMEATAAPMAKFRSEEEREDDDVVEFVDHRARFDQTKDLIILKKGDHAVKDIMTIANMTPWCQAFRRDFLEEHHMRYDERLHFGEDGMFTITAMKYADTVIVLPQTIGYVYFINHDSTLQQMGAPTPESILQMSNNLSMQMDAGIHAGLDMRYIFWVYAHDIAGMILGSPQMTAEQKEQVRGLLGGFFDQVEPLDPDGKFYTEDVVGEWMAFARSVILGGNQDTLGERVAEDVLTGILKDNRNTNIGRNYEFHLIHTKEAFEAKVPLSDYDYYAPLVKLTTRVGESDIFCHDKVEGYALTSGTMGVPKRIPYTKEHLKQYVDAFVAVCGNRKGSTLLMLPSLPRDHRFADNTYLDMISGAVLHTVEASLEDNSHAARFKDGKITSPKELLFPDETINPRHLRLLFALLDRELTQIVAPFTWTVFEMFSYLETHHKQIVNDIRNGTISMDEPISDGMRKKLEKRIKPDAARADKLEAIFAEGFDEPVLPKIWPGLERIVAAGTGDFSIYTEKLKRYTGEKVTFHNGYLMGSEAVVARSVAAGNDRYMLLTNHDYFEFLPLGADAPVQAKDVKAGEEYEIIVTNHAGLYRYRLGDVVRVDDVKDQIPEFTYLRRGHEICEARGITLTVNDMYDAVCALQAQADICDFVMGVNENDDGFLLCLEPSPIGSAYDDMRALSGETLCEAAEAVLGKKVGDYRKARESGSLNPLQVLVLEPETQLLFRDRNMYLWKCMPDQMKPVRVLDDPRKERFFLQFAK